MEPLAELTHALLAPGGAVANCHEAYEERDAQLRMAQAVAETLEQGGLLVVEAGTGVGKSLAYLTPAILWARHSGQPVVISTNTRNLQEQLIDHELPLLARGLPVAFTAALLKGRGNYPCLRTLSWLLADAGGSLFRAERLALAHLLAWLANSPDGDLESLSPDALEGLEPLSAIVQRCRSQGDACAGRACALRDFCRVEQVRAAARQADVIVVNHALTFAEAGTPFLPETSRLIFDEAQNIEAVATEGLAHELSSTGFLHFLRALGADGRGTGFITTLSKRLAANRDLRGVDEVLGALEDLPALADELDGAAEVLGEEVLRLCEDQGSRVGEGTRTTVRLTALVRTVESWPDFETTAQAFLEDAQALLSALQEIAEPLEDIQESTRTELQGVAVDAQAMAGRVQGMMEALAIVLADEGDGEGYVTWAETWDHFGAEGWSLRAAPVDVGALLRTLFYDRKEACIFTSATVTVEGRFDHFRRRIGLNLVADRLREETYPSPFDLEKQLLLCVPRDFPDPAKREFNGAVTEAILDICRISKGGTLALFTSRARMLASYNALEASLQDLGLRPLCQDVSGPRWWLLEQLREDDKVVLFGLKSFWEGVDVPGWALRCVILAKLPFAVPDDPIISARKEALQRAGVDGVSQYYIPEAILGFKQGVGRLIRRRTDRGVVFVLDPRLLTRGYGKRFFRSLQRCGLSRDPFEETLAAAEKWLGGGE